MQGNYNIKYVAIYIRKSRGDEEKDLEGHRNELVNICEENEWAYVEYAEIGSSDSIEARPKMVELLRDIEQDMYDAVLCIHLDRLSRGDSVDQAVIRKTFGKAEILVVTPSKVYDYNNDQDIMMAEFQGMIARMEYKEISRRFRQGKARRAKQGFWSNGVPPFPYIRNIDSGKAEPDMNKMSVYTLMKEKALNGYPSTDVAWELNKMGIESPRGGMWQPEVVRRLLLDEVHLGKVIVGKKRKHHTTGELIRKPKEEWIVYSNCHEAVKSQDEHNKLIFMFSRERKLPKASRSGKNSYSGLIKCDSCKSTMQIQKWKDRPSDSIKSCRHRDLLGTRCSNLGGSVDEINQYVLFALFHKKNQLEDAIKDGLNIEELHNLNDLSEQKLKEIREQEKVIDRIYRSHERNLYSKDPDKNDEIFIERRDIAELELGKMIEDHRNIKTQMDSTTTIKNEEMLISVKEVLDVLNDTTRDVKEINRALKSIIHSIGWERKHFDSPPTVTINFL